MGHMDLYVITMEHAVVKPISLVQNVMSGLLMQVNNN